MEQNLQKRWKMKRKMASPKNMRMMTLRIWEMLSNPYNWTMMMTSTKMQKNTKKRSMKTRKSTRKK